jgi:uncharacterized protein HemX
MRDEMDKVNPEDTRMDPMLQSALRDFRASVHAWSDAASSRPRPVVASAPRKIAWRRATAWVLSLTLSLGMVGTAAWEHHHQRLVAQEKQHQQEMERQRVLAEERARETEDLMANIDSDIARQVPSAMEPLALMADETQ